MSHFTVLVIGENPEEQLAPFNEHTEVPRYVEYTKEQLISNNRRDIQRYKNTTYAEYLKDPIAYANSVKNPQHLNYLEKEFAAKLNWNDDQVYLDAIKYYELDQMGPDGEVYSTYNPKSKWDWYQLGGRWAGSLEIKEGAKVEQPNFSWGWNEKEKAEVLTQRRADTAIKKDIANIDTLTTFAVLKDGEWYEKGEMGWGGMVSNEKDEEEWESKVRELLQGLPDDTLLSVYDCHI